MRGEKIRRREFLRKLGGWLAASAGLLITGTLPGSKGVGSPCGHPAKYYRKLAG
jgi:hypothetical protein